MLMGEIVYVMHCAVGAISNFYRDILVPFWSYCHLCAYLSSLRVYWCLACQTFKTQNW